MEDAFIPESLNIRALFTNSLFKIPDYQRPYSWEDQQVEQLWEDIQDSYSNENKNYFLGSVITVKQKGTEREDIVDGQQRLTTFMILFCVLRDTYPNVNDNINTEEDEIAITIKSLQKFIKDSEDRVKIILKTHASDQNDFRKFLDGKIDPNLKKPSKKDIKNNVKDRFLNTAYIFQEKLKKIGKEEAGKLLNYIGHNIKIIKIKCGNQSFAIKLFQILNDRGMDLSHSDLIKSSLMSRLNFDNKDAFISTWDQTIQITKEIDNMAMNDFFTLYLYSKSATNPKKSLSEEINNIFQNEKDSNKSIADFKKFCEIYKEKINNLKNERKSDHKKIIYSLRYIPWSNYWKAILLTTLRTNYSNYTELAKEIRKFYYMYWIAGKTLTKVKQTSFNIIKWIQEKKEINFIRDKLKEKIEEDNVLSDTRANLEGKEVYYEKWIKPVLLMIEYDMEDDSKLNYIKLDNKLHIDHILPINYKKHEWKDITPEIETEFLHSIGNLTLLSGKKNISANNCSFTKKIEIYKGKGNQKGITGFAITRTIIDEADNQQPAWNKDSIKKRKNKFLTKIKTILDIEGSINPVSPNPPESNSCPAFPNSNIKSLFEPFQQKILDLSPDVKERSTKQYYAYKVRKTFIYALFQSRQIKIFLDLNPNELEENQKHIVKDATHQHYGSCNLEVSLRSSKDLPAIMQLVRQALEKQI